MRFNIRSLLVIFLLLSPSLSFTQSIFGIFIPNEKLALMCVIIQSSLNGYFFKSLRVASLFYIIAFIYLIISTVHLYNGVFNLVAINTISLFLSLPIYIIYFRKNIESIFFNLNYIVGINLLISIIQQYNCLLDPNWVNVFNNYPHQLAYNFPENGFGFYRSAGLFNESSQYSLFLSLFVIFYLKKIVKHSKLNALLVILSTIEIIINQSTSSIIIIILYGLYFAYKNKKFRIGIIFLMAAIAPFIFDLLYVKLSTTLSMGDVNSYPRLILSYNSIYDAINEHFFFGRGLTWSNPSWDIYSIYLSGFGIIGLVPIIILLIFIYLKSNFLFPLFLISTLVNGNLLISINIFLICIIFNYKYIPNENINRNPNL